MSLVAPASRVRRRLVGAVAGGAALSATPLVRAQARAKVAHVVLADPMPPPARNRIRDELAKDGFVEGKNLRLEQIPILHAPPEIAEARAREVVASKPDVIFMAFGPEVVLLKHLTSEIPIVFFSCYSDPARAGLVASISRPGGNLTGTYHDYEPMLVKRWALFREVMPSLKRGAWVGLERRMQAPAWKHREAAEAYARGFLSQDRAASAAAARQLGIDIAEVVLPGDPTEPEIIAAVRRARPEAVRLTFDFSDNGPLERFLISEKILNELVVRVGANTEEIFRASIGMIGRILKGDRPAAMPVIQGAQYTVKANPRMAKEMGIVLPQSVLLQAGILEK